MAENKPYGLYRPEFEHDSCGVGIVADILGRRSHRMVQMGLEVLDNLAHRGACGCDPKTGDGGGMLLQMPHAFFRQRAADVGIALPAPGHYGVAMVFLPWEAEDRAACQSILEATIKEEGQTFLGWRDVPVDDSGIGVIAQDSEPVIRQAFVGRNPALPDQDSFERKLYVIRKVVERKISQSSVQSRDAFYISSLSSNTVVYKGLLMPEQVRGFFLDLSDPLLDSSFVLVHSRFSTNTLGSWRLAHPYRYIAHNGEINTLRGNINWMAAREMVMTSPLFGEDIKKLVPVLTPGASDTATIDNAIELLALSGRSLPHVMAMLIPEAWEGATDISPEKRAFYEYHSFLMEPWDGPALIAFTDGKKIGANLDRNGLRPFRYTVTKDNLIVMASEAGVLQVPPENVLYKGRLRPGRMMLIDPEEGRVLDDEEIKSELASRQPYGQWLADNVVRVDSLPDASAHVHPDDYKTLLQRQQAFGYTLEEIRMILQPMFEAGSEAIGSMGTDTPLAVLSDKPQILFSYFKQLFAQVTNPPLDAIREELVTSLEMTFGAQRNLLAETPEHARQIRLSHPILSNEELERVRHINLKGNKAITLKALFNPHEKGNLEQAMDDLCAQATKAVHDGYTAIILSDRDVDADHAPIPSLLACAGVHHRLIRQGLRTRAGLLVESGEPRDLVHCALLMGYGATAVNPYLVFETIKDMEKHEALSVDAKTGQKNFTKAVEKGILKVASKMGISTIQGYQGAQIFEAVGLAKPLVDKYFTWTPSRVGGVGIDVIEDEARQRHARAFAPQGPSELELDPGGQYQWRRGGEYHMYNPETIARLQISARTNNYKLYREFADLVDVQDRQLSTLRGLLELKWADSPVPLAEVEPASEIVKRFATGAISLGAISKEAHETLAIAMNRIGARSNTGEGGEDYRRFHPDPNGDSRSSAVKQVASGRFGVTTNYLVNARDLQIKMAQGSKPGEGGQLPGHKVDDYIGWIRHTTPGVELISPPPHHDIYSIEDLAQLIHVLKNVNPDARIHVKLVSEVGVGTIAAGVSKAHADVVLISGDSGGTGASPESSIKTAGLPWELGLAETHQVLVRNDLRGRIAVQTDGQLKTGRDVAIACLLGAEEFGFAT
ncbi:MAG: glutamate synthase large subunit, partial [Chloroflexi bacterium]|nr:glutamate synthase large subunit [Chloroflexota bacterium]